MRNRGFTLIEMLLATVLTSVLMLGVLAVIISVSAPIKAAGGDEPEVVAARNDVEAIVRAMKADLTQARTLEAEGGELRLMSYGGLDTQTCDRTQRPVRIRYLVRTLAGRSWLMREERALDGEVVQAIRTQLVAEGVTRIELQPPADMPVGGVGSRTARAATESGEQDEPELPVDGLWRLRVWLDAMQGPAVDRPIVMRRSLMK